MKTLTPSDIRYLVTHNTDSKFFDRKTMQFFGDLMTNFATYTDEDGQTILYRRKPVKNGLCGKWAFDPVTYRLRSVA